MPETLRVLSKMLPNNFNSFAPHLTLVIWVKLRKHILNLNVNYNI